MDRIEKQMDFSILYKCLIDKDSGHKRSKAQHPFSFLSDYLSQHVNPRDIENFDESLTYQMNIKADVSHAYQCFLLEMSLLKTQKASYLNRIVNDLFKCYYQSKEVNVIIYAAIRDLFLKICSSHFNIFLNNTNRNKLSKWHTLKEPIKSFRLKKLPEDKWFESRFWHGIRGGFEYQFLARDTPFSSFKALFEGKYVENKINWIDHKSSLCYFIQSLISEKVIHSPKNKHWEIVAEFILLKGEPIKQSELINQKVTTNKGKRQEIDRFIKMLSQYNY